MSENPLVSIAVTTRNSGKTLWACLESIRLQTYEPIELIVVDNYSEDDTIEIAQQFTDHVYQLGPERSAQRNHALLERASGKIFGYVDSDMILGPGVVDSAVEYVTAGAAGIYVEEIILARGLYGSLRRFERGAYTATVIDAVRFFRSDFFLHLSGFDESLPPGPEDWDLDVRLRTLGPLTSTRQAMQSPSLLAWSLSGYCRDRGLVPKLGNAIYHDESNQGIYEYVRKKGYYSEGLARYREKWGTDSKVVEKQFSPLYRLFGVFFQRNYWRVTLSNPHLFFGIFCLRLLVAAQLGFDRLRAK